MATLVGSLTIAEVTKRLDPQGRIADIGELLEQSYPIISDMPMIEANGTDGHVFSQRTALPSPTWNTANAGISPTASSVAQNKEACGLLSDLIEVEKRVAEHGGQLQANLKAELDAHVEGMGQELAQTLFYGNVTTAPNEIHGIFPRYNATTNANGQNIILGGGAGADNSSIVLVGWGPGKVFGIYPKGSKAGLEIKNMGLQQVTTTAGAGSAGARMLAYQTWLNWNIGIAIQDWRYIVRIPNIDISVLVANSSPADLYDKMISAIHCIPNLSACKPVFYMNRTVRKMLDIQTRDAFMTGGGITSKTVDGMPKEDFRGIPVKTVDCLTELESVVS